MNMKHLTSSAVRARRVRRSHDQSHAANSAHVEVEALAGAKPRRTDDLNLDQLSRPAADTVDGLGAEVNPAPEFADPEFGSVGDQAAGVVEVFGPSSRRRGRPPRYRDERGA